MPIYAPTQYVGSIPSPAFLSERTYRIAAAGTQSLQEVTAGVAGAEVDLDGVVPVALWTPVAWTAAAITFLATRDGGGTWADLFDDAGVEVSLPSASIPTTAVRRFALNPRLFLGISKLRLRSGVSGNEVPQAAQRDLVVALRAIG